MDDGHSLTYDGFISYSHAADDLLAPHLQAGLQRFAKPWWKRRALRIFRDEASLAANPHLWESITKALNDSEWFIVLLSPEAARSKWVNREVEYWLEHKDPDRIIPVLTEGDYRWNEGRIESDAAPPALVDAFRDQPRWVDLRFARTVDHLDLRHAAFRGAVADVAAPLRGVPKDELESEEIHQHRRTVRTAWAAAVALLLLTVAAGGAAAYAIGQAARATEEAARSAEFSEQLLDFTLNLVRPGDLSIQFDVTPIPLPVAATPPATPRLDFLKQNCRGGVGCTSDAAFVHPELPLQTKPWLAYEPFHIRHGFVEIEGSPGSFYDLQVFVVRVSGPELPTGAYELHRTYRLASDYLVIETTDRCGPDFENQSGPQTCTRFVHEFPDGLPPGRYAIWVEWHAPCAAWTVGDVCERPAQIINLFNSSAVLAFYHDDFTTVGGFSLAEPRWPFDPWDVADPIS
jgi:hypothetical protein